MKNITVLLLFLIFILGAILRFYRLGEIPQGFHRDEAFLGYNAYSILQTGKDMNGNFLPLHLQSFIYSPAGYSYLSIPFIKLFDLSPFSVRFASAIFGSLTILLTYFFVKQLFHPRGVPQAQHHLGGVEIFALASSFFLAISPWHINLSRTATENTIVVFLISLGVWLFLVFLRKGSIYLLATSFLAFAATLVVYQSPQAFLPLFIPLLLFLFLRAKKDRKRLVLSIFLFCITIILPLMLVLSSKELTLRIRTVSIFATEETQLTIDEQIREDGVSSINPLISRAFHNKLIGYSSQFIDNYFSHFSFDFLFEDDGSPIRYKIPNSGLLYFFELPLILVGFFILLRQRSREGMFLIGWLMLAPLGSALTFDDVPNLQRTLIMLPVLTIIEALGLAHLFVFFREKQKAFGLFLGLLVLYSVLFYLHQYYVHGPRFQPWHRHDGYKELVAKVNELLPNYGKAVITNRESAPTIFFLFFGKYNPSLFQDETKNNPRADMDRISFDKYEFSQEECPLSRYTVTTGQENILYVNDGVCKLSDDYGQELAQIKRGDGSVVFRIFRAYKTD